MKKKIMALSTLCLAGGVFSTTAGAADGTIHFTGTITDQTCTVDSSSANLTVPLGNIARTALNGAAGMKAAPTRFTLTLTNCPETVKGASVKFDGLSDSTNPDLLALDSGDGVASGVGIEIADKSGTPVPLHTASPQYALSSGSNNLVFVARYVSTGTAVTTGRANGTSQFTIDYK
ncbi:TPA: fimbrial protein [Salmonella enterica subsp. enterica serovar Eastbourne]|nr:fimbrial protein [Salmonella enterica subsp. enterica serovar Eastbourne]